MSVWFDLPVQNLADAMSFYEGLLGWTYRQMENSPIADYVLIEDKAILIGGFRRVEEPLKKTLTFSSPLVYFTVDKLEAAVARARDLGADIVGEIMNLGKERGRYQWIRDREGNLIGLWAAH